MFQIPSWTPEINMGAICKTKQLEINRNKMGLPVRKRLEFSFQSHVFTMFELNI